MGVALSAPISSKHLDRHVKDTLKVGAAEMQGYRVEQEDQHSIHLSLPVKPEYSFIGVYDGHSGAKTSAWLQKELYVRVAGLSDPMNESDLSKCVQQADLDFISTEAEGEQPHGSACIFTVFKEREAKKEWDVLVANVGDSRSILLHPDGTFEALSEDHKPENAEERKRIEDAGGSVSDNRVDGQLAMSRAMGDAGYKRNQQLKPDEQKVIAVPEFRRGVARPGDLLLVCCDGIVEALSNEHVSSYLHAERQMETDTALLCAALLEFSLKSGSKDNHTAVLVEFSTESLSAYEAKPKKEFIAGPFTPYSTNEKFSKAYKKDAARFGLTEQELMASAKVTEESKKMEVFALTEDHQEHLQKLLGDDVLKNPKKLQALQKQLANGGGNFPQLPVLSQEEQQAALLREKIAQISSAMPVAAPKNEKEKKNDKNNCAVCDTSEGALKACGACKTVVYCSADHQKQHWKAHKGDCKKNRA